MKSKRLMKAISLLLAAAAVISGRDASAAAFSAGYANEDLLLNFRQFTPGTGAGTFDVTYDLGNVNTFLNTYHDQSVQLNSPDFMRPNAYDPSLLTGAAGANYGSLNNVLFSAVAANFSANVDDMWATRVRGSSTDNTVPDSVPWTAKTAFSQSGAAGKIDSVGNNANNFGLTLSPTAARTTDSTPQSYDTISGGGTFNNYYIPTTEGGTGSAFAAGDVVRVDFYQLQHTASGTAAATYEGYFELQGNGDMHFVGAQFVVPEPSTYGLIGVGLLALGLRKKFTGK